jgi:hypothetical protein
MSKIINVIGGGLCGSLTAYFFKKKYPKYKVILIEQSDRLLSAFDPIKISDFNFNNGFHGIELPRANDLKNFFKNINVEFDIIDNEKYLYIDGYLVSYSANTSSFPLNLKKHFKSSPFLTTNRSDFLDIIDTSYRELLEKVSRRYSNNFSNSLAMMIPWFYPADYELNTDDEGDFFRNKVRKGEIRPYYAIPKSGLFFELQGQMYSGLVQAGIEVIFNSNIQISDDGIKVSISGAEALPYIDKADYTFFCASPIGILKKLDLTLYENLVADPRNLINAIFTFIPRDPLSFTEILCCDKKVPEVSRLSLPHGRVPRPGAKFLQAEIFSDSISISEEYITEKVAEICTKIGFSEISLIGQKPTRKVFFPDSETINAANKIIKDYETNHGRIKINPNFGPINMTKAWLWAKACVDNF